MLTATSNAMVLTSTEIDELPWEHFHGVLGVRFKTLWRDPAGSSYSGLMKMQSGARIPPHTHRFAFHHVWVESGSCRVGAHTFGPGAYLHVPRGVEHGIDEAGPGGCTLWYLYLASSED